MPSPFSPASTFCSYLLIIMKVLFGYQRPAHVRPGITSNSTYSFTVSNNSVSVSRYTGQGLLSPAPVGLYGDLVLPWESCWLWLSLIMNASNTPSSTHTHLHWNLLNTTFSFTNTRSWSSLWELLRTFLSMNHQTCTHTPLLEFGIMRAYWTHDFVVHFIYKINIKYTNVHQTHTHTPPLMRDYWTHNM